MYKCTSFMLLIIQFSKQENMQILSCLIFDNVFEVAATVEGSISKVAVPVKGSLKDLKPGRVVDNAPISWDGAEFLGHEYEVEEETAVLRITLSPIEECDIAVD